MARGELHRSLDADVAVVGAGPAGAAAAAAVAASGLRVTIVDPHPDRRWSATYGAWADDLPGAPEEVPVRARYDEVIVRARSEHRVARPYVLLDNDALARRLRGELVANGGTVTAGSVIGVQHFTWGSRLRYSGPEAETGGGRLDAGLVVDASGAGATLVQRPESRRPPAWQSAWGVIGQLASPPAGRGSCVLMDWTGPDDADPDPTFLYAMDLGDGTWLAEETSLARRPPLDLDVLRRRLDARLARVGADAAGGVTTDVVATEVVAIPLDLPVPGGDQPVVGFGAAASLVHPATGYSVAASLRAAPRLAAAIRAAVDRRAGPAATARAAWSAIWPRWRRRARALEGYGLDALLRLRRCEMQDFFDAFFTQPLDATAGYLRGDAAAGEIAGLMAGIFTSSRGPLRGKLVTGDPRRVLRALV